MTVSGSVIPLKRAEAGALKRLLINFSAITCAANLSFVPRSLDFSTGFGGCAVSAVTLVGVLGEDATYISAKSRPVPMIPKTRPAEFLLSRGKGGGGAPVKHCGEGGGGAIRGGGGGGATQYCNVE